MSVAILSGDDRISMLISVELVLIQFFQFRRWMVTFAFVVLYLGFSWIGVVSYQICFSCC